MRRHALMLASLLVLLAGCQSAEPPAAGMASLRIKVIAEPKAGVKSPEEHVRVYDAPPVRDSDHGGDFEKVDYDALENIVIWIQPVDPHAATAPIPAPATFDVNPRQASTGLAGAACVGQQLIFRNTGARAGNIYSVSDGNDFNLGSLAPGAQGTYTVRSPGLIEVLSDAQEDPVATVYAAPTPWFSVARSGAAVEFANLPPGRYRVVSWHPRLPGYDTTVDLSPNQVTTTTTKVGVNGLPKIAPK